MSFQKAWWPCKLCAHCTMWISECSGHIAPDVICTPCNAGWSSCTFSFICHISNCDPFTSQINHPEGWDILSKPYRLRCAQKGLRLPAPCDYIQISNFVCLDLQLCPHQLILVAELRLQLHCATPTSIPTLPPTFTSSPTTLTSTLVPQLDLLLLCNDQCV